MEEIIDPRQRIILAAIDMLNIDGVGSITTRRIAEMAGVNSAAMNYYFGSKDNLIDYIMDTTLEHAFNDWKMILELEELDFPVRVYCLLDFTMEGISRYPGIVRSHLFDPDVKEKTKLAFAEKTSSLLDKLSEGLSERIPMTQDDLRLSLGQILLSVLSAAMIPELFTSVTGDVIFAAHARSHFILHLLKRFLGIEVAMTDIIKSNIAQVRNQAFRSV
jgi:AcrR family transcriptional regulator